MTKETQKLNVVGYISATGGLVLLGILGYRMMFGKSKRINKEIKEQENKTQPIPTSVEPSKTETVNDVELHVSENEQLIKEEVKKELKTYSTPEELMIGLCEIILGKTKVFNRREEFFEEIIRMIYLNVLDPGWIEKAPRTVEDCDKLLKECGLWELYTSKFIKNEEKVVISSHTYVSSIPPESRRKGVKRLKKMNRKAENKRKVIIV